MDVLALIADYLSDQEEGMKNFVTQFLNKVMLIEALQQARAVLPSSAPMERSRKTTLRPPVVTWVELSKKDPHVAWVLRLIGYDFETWSGLYKIYEAIEADVGNIPRKGWCTKTELRKFKQTANSPEALGVHARHGKVIQAPPDPVSLSSAKSLIRRLLNEWFKMKRAQSDL